MTHEENFISQNLRTSDIDIYLGQIASRFLPVEKHPTKLIAP